MFVRSVRKLTSRFNPVFYEGDDKVSKISPYIQTIDELLEEFDPLRPIEKLGDIEKIKKNAENLLTQCEKLESSFMYDSVPVSHIRNASSWARFTTSSGKKVLIIENADRMLETVRNALLKILEEPPEDTLFILTTSKRGAVMPTILSRVRTYPFIERTEEQNNDVISRVFHDEGRNINDYLCGFLPVSKENFGCKYNRNSQLSMASSSICNIASSRIRFTRMEGSNRSTPVLPFSFRIFRAVLALSSA